MTEINLARHGDTEGNGAEVFRGRADIELNKTGVEQAALLAGYLSKRKVAAVYSSPLQRALKTAQAIAGCHQLCVEIAPGLTDLDYGAWQGLSHEVVKDKYPGLYSRWTDSPEQVTMPAGESLSDVRERALEVVYEVIARYQGTVVLVSHRVVNKVLICALLGLDDSHFWNIRQDTCGITIFECENRRFILTQHNNTSHLEALHQAPLSDF